jgi:hypothetical protein
MTETAPDAAIAMPSLWGALCMADPLDLVLNPCTAARALYFSVISKPFITIIKAPASLSALDSVIENSKFGCLWNYVNELTPTISG